MPAFPSTYGQYELLELVETAPLYELFLARRPGESDFSKTILLKRLAPMLEAHAPSNEVFTAAAKLASTLLHPCIVHTLELGSVGSSLYMTMEYASGIDLAAVQRELAAHERQIALPVAVWIAHEILDALDHAHSNGIVHGNLAATRVLLGAAGDIKVKDFGAAQALHLAKFGDAAPLDARDDLLAVGILLAELVTNWRLFVSANDGASLWNKLEQIQPALVEVELGLADVVLKALRQERDSRWQTAAAFRDALGEWLFEHRHRVSGQDVIGAVAHAHGKKPVARPKSTPGAGVPQTSVPTTASRQTTLGKLHPSRTAKGAVGSSPSQPKLAHGSAPPSSAFADSSPPETPAIDPAGTFSAVASPLRILCRLATSRAAGLFVISSGAVKKQISIRDGHVDWVTSNMAGERFDAYLAKNQLVSTRDLAGALTMTSERVDLVDAIIGLGLLQPREMRRHLTDHLRAAVVEACTWKRGNYVWFGKDSAKPRVEGVSVDLFEALGAAASAVSESTIAEWAASHATLAPSPTPRVDPERFNVEGLGPLLISVGKTASVDQLAGSQVDSRQRRLRMLYLLEACELVIPG